MMMMMMMEQVPHLLQWHALFDNVWDVELGEVDVLVQRRQLVNKRNLPTKFLAAVVSTCGV